MGRSAAYTVLGLALVVGIAAMAPGGGASSSVAAACDPGSKKIDGVQVVTFCGPAKATVKFRGKTVSFRNGACVRSKSGTWAINVGTATPPPAQPKSKYFGITIGKVGKLGSTNRYKKAAVGFQWSGRSYGVTGAIVTLKGKGARGTFAGRLDGAARAKVVGSFTC